jgi:hypothetical protein
MLIWGLFARPSLMAAHKARKSKKIVYNMLKLQGQVLKKLVFRLIARLSQFNGWIYHGKDVNRSRIRHISGLLRSSSWLFMLISPWTHL